MKIEKAPMTGNPADMPERLRNLILNNVEWIGDVTQSNFHEMCMAIFEDNYFIVRLIKEEGAVYCPLRFDEDYEIQSAEGMFNTAGYPSQDAAMEAIEVHFSSTQVRH